MNTKLNILVALCIAGFLQTGCDVKSNLATDAKDQSRECSTISEKTAILIAQGDLQISFTSEDYAISAIDKGGEWEIHFDGKCAVCQDGKPYVVIDKASGDVVQTFRHGKPYDSNTNSTEMPTTPSNVKANNQSGR